VWVWGSKGAQVCTGSVANISWPPSCVDTANMDGETNLKVKFCNAQTASFDCAGEAGPGVCVVTWGCVVGWGGGGMGVWGWGQQRLLALKGAWIQMPRHVLEVSLGWGDRPQSEVL
jgi:hypothetical protein